ncbi:hypothetical protein Glove_24g40 [Diversispora epigaea]|uniref:Uncharacterized protein n=1 Tax=Diversispora epigaea TaxID=1348612 RepID=A0A397JTM9_9GLOM|nr:hypothetical protein Glove_24g40 [Diversispora epigaea]
MNQQDKRASKYFINKINKGELEQLNIYKDNNKIFVDIYNKVYDEKGTPDDTERRTRLEQFKELKEENLKLKQDKEAVEGLLFNAKDQINNLISEVEELKKQGTELESSETEINTLNKKKKTKDIQKITGKEKEQIEQFFKSNSNLNDYEIDQRFLISNIDSYENNITKLVEFSKRLFEETRPVYEYAMWRSQYDTLMENNGSTIKELKSRGVKVQKLRQFGHKALKLKFIFGEIFVKNIKISKNSLYFILEENLKTQITNIKNSI